MNSRMVKYEQEKQGSHEDALSQLKSLTLEQQDPCTAADCFGDRVRSSLLSRDVVEGRPSSASPIHMSTKYLSRSRSPPRDRQSRVDDEDENQAIPSPRVGITATRRNTLLLLPPVSRAQRGRKRDVLSKSSAHNKIEKLPHTSHSILSTRHWKNSKATSDHFGRILKARQNFDGNSITLKMMLSPVNQRCKDDLDMILNSRHSVVPAMTKRRSRSLTSREERHRDNFFGLTDNNSCTKNDRRVTDWSGTSSDNFASADCSLSRSISEYTTVPGDENGDTKMEDTSTVDG